MYYPHVRTVAEVLLREHVMFRGFLGGTRYVEYIFAVAPAPLTGGAALLIHTAKNIAMILGVRLGEFLTYISSEAQM